MISTNENQNKEDENHKKYTIKVKEIENLFFCSNGNINNYQNLLTYYDNKDILNDKLHLEKIIEELKSLINSEYDNILIPFLSPPCDELLEAYINSDLDEDENIKSYNDFKYIQIFEKLKNYLFISNNNVYLIYSYFGKLFYDAKNIEQNDKRLSKFLKYKELWRIFYTLPENKENNKKSNIIFIGGKLLFELNSNEIIDLNKNDIIIKINFLNNNYLGNANINNINFLIINNIEFDIAEKIKKDKKLDINKLSCLEFKIQIKKVNISFIISGKQYNSSSKINELIDVKNIILLENYYGMVQSIEITLINKNNKKESYQKFLHYPIPTTEENVLCSIEKMNNKSKYYKKLKGKEVNLIDLTFEKEPYKLKIENNKLIKVNYINYNEENYNIIEYFGGLTQLLPFLSLIKNLYENENIQLINNQNKNDILSDFVKDIIISFINIIFHYKEYMINIKKYCLFFFSIICELDNVLFSKSNLIVQFVNNLGNDITAEFSMVVVMLFNLLKNDKNLNFNEILSISLDNDKNILYNNQCYLEQLYTKLMKELFIFNRNWSLKDLFYNLDKGKDKISIKYKRLSYYTKSFQQPFIYPILEMDKYFPNFIHFNKEDLFKNKNEKYLNYNFSLSENNILINGLKNYISNNSHKQNIEFEKCCLVKTTHHIKGKIGIKKNIEEDNESFDIIFISNDNQVEYTCNKELKPDKKIRSFIMNNKNICFGAIFSTPKKEFNKKLVIKSDEIVFLLIREYYHRVSAIEIFTINNKSYYFNFNKKFNIKKKKLFPFIEININNSELDDNNNDNGESIINNDEENNNIQKDVDENNNNLESQNNLITENKNMILSYINDQNFKPIFINDLLLGYYNQKYKENMFPLFENNLIYSYQFKNKYYSNYDILILINLLSNRSFRDLYQYPVFPMLYDIINKKRVLNKHIGLQELDNPSKTRKDLINQLYNISLEDQDTTGNFLNSLKLFNTLFSNPVYTSHYLIRVFPYSFSSIELQGEGFDNPNRLFYSIEGAMTNSLTQKSDLRELIPEIFYFYELFKNKNDLKFDKLVSQKDIDTVIIKNNNQESDKDIYQFLVDMRNLLEKEEKLNEWIDLIFGVNQKEDEENRKYFDKECFINYENRDNILNNFSNLY